MNEYRLATEIDRRQWSDFVWNHADGNIFQTPEMFDVFMMTKNNQPILMAVTDAAGQILGILVVVIQIEYAEFIGKFSSRAIIRGGPLILNNNVDVLNFMLKEYNKVIPKRAIYSEVRNLCQQAGGFKECFEKNGFIYEEHLNILLNIEQPEEALWKNIHSKRRNEIRRARKEGTFTRELTCPKEIEEVYDILKDVYDKAGLPLYDRSMFSSAFGMLRPNGLVRFFGAINRDKLIGVIIVLCYKDRVYDWYAGSRREYYHKYPNDLLPWETFLWGKKNGYKIFDFGGTGKPNQPYGVRDYKKKFGGEFVCFGRYEKIHKPFLMKIAKLGFKLWQELR